MIHKKKIRKLAPLLLLVIFLTASVFSACDAGNISTETDNPQYDFSVYFGDSDNSIQITNLIARYERITGVSVEPIFSEGSTKNNSDLERMLNRKNPVSAFIISEGEDFERISEKEYVANITNLLIFGEDNLYKGENNNSPVLVEGNRLLWEIEGIGIAVDKELLGKLFLVEDTESIIFDFKSASFQEWKEFVEKFEEYILMGAENDVVLNGTTYSFSNEKSDDIKKLTGAYAIPGYENAYTGNYLINSVMAGIRMNEWKTARSIPEEDAFEVIVPGVRAYSETLDFITQHLAGTFAPAIRGKNFIEKKHYNFRGAENIFSNGHALFTITTTGNYDRLFGANSDKAKNTVFLPIKMPLRENGILREDINSKIASNIKKAFCINSTVSVEMQRDALDFGLWIAEQIAMEENSLQRSAREYYITGQWIKDYSNTDEVALFYNNAFVSDKGIKSWLSDENWSDEDKERLHDHLFGAWY